MESSEASRGLETAVSIAAALSLPTHGAALLRNSNKLAVRLLPCEVFARVSHAGDGLAKFEVDLAVRLADSGTPIALLEPRVEPRSYERDGFEVSFWTYYEVVTPASSSDLADSLARLHAGMRAIDVPTPHFTDRVADPGGNIRSTSALDETDRRFLIRRLRELEQRVVDRGAPDQVLHGEPHTGNVLSTASGPRFIDLETCCRGPVEFDLAHLPSAVMAHYPSVDKSLFQDCRGLILAMVAKHRCAPADEFPDRVAVLHDLVRALRAGPPWPALDAVIPIAGS